jgi:hypothetical protein
VCKELAVETILLLGYDKRQRGVIEEIKAFAGRD